MNAPRDLRRWLGAPQLPPVLAVAGAAVLLLAERIWPGTAATPYLAGLGAAALVAALALNLPPFLEGAGAGGLRPVAGWLAAPYALAVAAVAGFFASGALPAGGAVDWADLAGAGWALAALAAAVLLGFVTLARISQGRVPGGDPRRIRLAGSAGLSMALLAVGVVLLNLVFARLPWQWNLAYFKITQPSEATREAADTLAQPVEVAAFFAPDSEVRPLIRAYFEALGPIETGPAPAGEPGATTQAAAGGEGGGRLHVRFLDAHLNPDQADAYKVRDNGWVALKRGGQVLPVQVGEELDRARATLRTFDRTFFTKLVEISRPKATVYLTAGHGERTDRDVPGSGPAHGKGALTRFRTLLSERAYTVKPLGLADGLGERVPADAALVISAAPTAPFLAEEAAALRTYLDGGGRLLAFLEPDTGAGAAAGKGGLGGVTLAALLKDYGLRFDAAPLANDRFHARLTNTKADRALLFTAQYQAHPVTANLRRVATQFPLLFLGAGGLAVDSPPDTLEAKPLVLAMPGTWADDNHDFEFDAGEKRSQPGLVVGVSRRAKGSEPKGGLRPHARRNAGGQPVLVAFADADVASDLLIPYRANRLAIDDALGWLVARDKPVGLPRSEEDVPIQHARSDDWLWFYLPVLGVPALVLAFGVVRVRRRRRSRGGGSDD